jgi:DTW domain-containing protein YfiP
MLRQSPWLKALPKVKIQSTYGQTLESHFKLRRNQQGLCTLEAIEAAIIVQAPLAAQGLKRNFHLFQNTLLGLLR